MSTSYYMKLPLRGTDSCEIESLGSFITRLAYLHGATRFQFLHHLSSWWSRHNPSQTPLPQQCIQSRLSGYSQDVSLLITALEQSTHVPDIRASTLLSLQDVCAKNCVGATRRHRAWCPRCYQEDREAGDSVYDRLLWRLQAYERCSIHGLRLVSECPGCGSAQGEADTFQALDECSKCRECLWAKPYSWDYLSTPELGEKDLVDIVGYVARNPATRFRAMAPWEFLDSLGPMFNKTDLVQHAGDIFHTRKIHAQPQLNSLLWTAAYFDAPLLQVLLSPVQAGRQVTLDIPCSRFRDRPKRRKLDKERLARYRAALMKSIEKGAPYPSRRDLALQCDMSYYARPPELRPLLDKLDRLRRSEIRKRGALQVRKVDRSINAELSRGSQRTKRLLIRHVIRETGAPVHLVRKRVKALSPDRP